MGVVPKGCTWAWSWGACGRGPGVHVGVVLGMHVGVAPRGACGRGPRDACGSGP